MKYPKSEPAINERAITGPRSLRDPHSREYAIQTMESLKRFLDSKTFSAKHAETELGLIKTYKHWEVLGFETLDDYLKAELGFNQRQLRARLAQDLAADPNVKPAAEHGTNQHTRGGAISTSSHGSTQASTIVRRLKRDYPKIAKALARGEFPSARAAAIAAGICKVPSALEQIRRLIPKLTPEEWGILAGEFIALARRQDGHIHGNIGERFDKGADEFGVQGG
jgi:hypothetical protein